MRIRLSQAWLLLIVLLIFILSISACGGGGSDSTPASTPTNSIGSSGGAVTSSDGKVVVSVPQGALSQQTEITVGQATNPPSGNIGVAYEFGPSGTTFSQPVTISITYDETALPQGVNEADLRLGNVVNNQWVLVSDSSVDVAANKVTGTTTHFSIYGVVNVNNISGTWTVTGSMTTPRVFSAATLLPNGKVLVAGGCTADPCTTVLASAELYDPTSGTWTATGSMTSARNDHAATLLPNGKVLVAGGRDFNDNLTASAELYDPSTGTWATTGSMINANNDQTATLLPNGKVLVTGGCCDSLNNLFASAELYDPAIGTWTATGSMTAGRVGHTATLLPNGKVLVAGGCSTSGCTLSSTSAELYDPAIGTWTATGSMTAAINSHSATLLQNGKVLVAGGNDINDIPIPSAELYDPVAGVWTTTGSMANARTAPGGVLLPNGKVLVTGGCSNANPCTTVLASSELYDPAAGTWTATAAMTTARVVHSAMLLPNGKVLVIGGFGSGSVGISSAELYTP